MEHCSMVVSLVWLRRYWAVLVMMLAGAFEVHAQGRNASRITDVIHVDEIRPGMKGYGLTVFRGHQPERFKVEVIDVMRRFRPGMDLILIRTDHPLLDHAKVVAGMSGSPIYLDGRLAGAYAYGWSFGKDPVAGVTPIKHMFDDLAQPIRKGAFGRAGVGVAMGRARAQAAKLAGVEPWLELTKQDPVSRMRAHQDALGLGGGPDGFSTFQAKPMATPLMLGGFSDGAARFLSEQLRPYGLVAVQGGLGAGGGGSRASGSGGFVNGGAIGVQLIGGDMDATAVGTVTHVRGNRLVAFGHPMMNAGQTGFPVVEARVLHVLASQARSFKLSESLGEPVGTLVNDRMSSIVVDQRRKPVTVPMRIDLVGVPKSLQRRWNLRIASHRVMTPMLCMSALASVIEATVNDRADAVVTFDTTVRIDGHGPVSVRDQLYAPAGAADMRALGKIRAFLLMALAYGNPFEDSRVSGVSVKLRVDYGLDRVAMIKNARVLESTVDPGGKVVAVVELATVQGATREERLEQRVPAWAAGQKVSVQLRSGSNVPPAFARPKGLEDLIDLVRGIQPTTTLAMSLYTSSSGMRFEGHVAPNLPPSAAAALRHGHDTRSGAPVASPVHVFKEVAQVVHGQVSFDVTVRDAPTGR